MKNLTLKQARTLYKLDGKAKEIALDFFNEEELTQPPYTIEEDNGNVIIKGTIEGHQSNFKSKIRDFQSNRLTQIGGHQSNTEAQIGGDQINAGLKVEGKMFIDEDTEYKGGIWMLKSDGTDVEMQLVPKK